MSDDLQLRLKEIAKECGGNRALCEMSAISERTFANWLSGASEPKIIGISAIAQAAGVTIDWLVNGSRPKSRVGSREANNAELVQVPWLSKQLLDQHWPILQRLQVNDYIVFSKSYLQNKLNLHDFDQLCVLEMQGDSMEPTFGNGDLVLIDRTRKEASDGILAFIFDDAISLKRVVNTPKGLDVVSDNKDLYPPYTIDRHDQKDMQIIGHAVWIGKALL